MKTLAVLLCAFSVANAAFAQVNYNAAKRQARNAVTATQQASQGIPEKKLEEQQRSAAQTPPPMSPALAATLQNIANLQADFDNMKTNFTPVSYTNDLAAAASGKKPSTDSVAKLAGDLQNAVAGNERLKAQHQKLAQDVHATFNGAFLSPGQAETIQNDVKRILQNGGVPSDQITTVLDDIKMVSNETK